MVTNSEIRELVRSEIRELVHSEVQQELIRMGLDPSDPRGSQSDLAFIRTLRQSSLSMRTQGIAVAIGVLIPAMLGLMWLALRNLLGGK